MSITAILGGIVFLLGVFLFVGNITRLFPTVPLAGWITMAIGGAIYRAGRANEG